MPLQILEDSFSKEKHEELDKAVNESLDDAPLSILRDYHSLLKEIVDHSERTMDAKYHKLVRFKELSESDDGQALKEMLSSAWGSKSYREIRNLAILAAPGRVQKPSQRVASEEHQKLSKSFKTEYHGAAADGLYEYLSHNEHSFTSERRYCAKFCSIVQSSGTGKSRMLIELRNRDVITIYINLRDARDLLSFPPRDWAPSILLTTFPEYEDRYRVNCIAFFVALFRTVEEYLPKSKDEKKDLMDWVQKMCDMSPSQSATRDDFFQKLVRKYAESFDEVCNAKKTTTADNKKTTEDTDPDLRNLVLQFADLRISNVDRGGSFSKNKLDNMLETSFRRMAKCLNTIFPAIGAPKLVIAIDEAYPLAVPKPNYRPADVFCRVVKEYSQLDQKNHGVWVVFASTTSRVTDFSPPNGIYPSQRVSIDGEELFPPYTHLGWDQCAPRLEDINLEDVSKAKNIVGFGRPLWVSLMSMENSAPSKVLRLACEKLCSSIRYDPDKTEQMLAVLGQRFTINITFGHPDSMEYSEKGVASHLRICLGTTLDRTWRFTSYPSEPFLSCAAAETLHSMPTTVQASLKKLLNLVNAGVIDIGQRGELASRLLWLLAKDLFIRAREGETNAFPSSWDDDLVDCEMIPVVDWLGFVFGSKVWQNEGKPAREAFGNAYINFSHWVCMDSNIRSKDGEEFPLDEWTLRHWKRTSAVQCFRQQPLINKVIPLYFKDCSGSESARMSQILISDKARKHEKCKDALYNITRPHESIGGADFKSSLPYIAIVVNFSIETLPFEVTFRDQPSSPSLRILAVGADVNTYPFLADSPGLEAVFKDLCRLKSSSDTNGHTSRYLDTQMKFGSSATAEHMEWERGAKKPT